MSPHFREGDIIANPKVPFPMSGTITGVNSAVINKATVEVHNLRTGDIANTLTDGNGVWLLDLQNFIFDEGDDDPLLIRAFKGGELFSYAEMRATLDLGLGSIENLDLTLVPEHPQQPKDDDQKITTLKEHHITESAKKVFQVGERKYTETFAPVSGSPNKVEYHGWAEPGSKKDKPVWRILKLTYNGNFLDDIQWAGGNSNFDKIWDNRESFTYT